jgi:hypothetical protein
MQLDATRPAFTPDCPATGLERAACSGPALDPPLHLGLPQGLPQQQHAVDDAGDRPAAALSISLCHGVTTAIGALTLHGDRMGKAVTEAA